MSSSTKNRIPPFEQSQIEQISKIIGEALTHSDIEMRLSEIKIPDVDSGNSKWKRIYHALASFQNERQIGNHVIKFIVASCKPALFLNRPDSHRELISGLNAVLSFASYRIEEDGLVRRGTRSTSLNEALSRSNRMKEELNRRKVHIEVIKFCEAEIIVQNCFHAVLEAMKSITSRIRLMSGLSGDGAELVTSAFCLGKDNKPLIRINDLKTKTLLGEQTGFMNLLIGLYGTVRNPLGHEPKIEWDMTEQDALDILTTISLIHRKLDKAIG